MSVCIDSEIAPLKKVIIHSPGSEIESMTPETAEEVLYNDIIPLSIVRKEHRQLKQLLEKVSEVFEFTELLETCLRTREQRHSLVNEVCLFEGIPGRKQELLEMEPKPLVRVLIGGLPAARDNLQDFLSGKTYDIVPIPNLYFTRDSGMVCGNGLITAAMANRVRQLEAILVRHIFLNHSEFHREKVLFDGTVRRSELVTLEGGDFLVESPDTLIIGLSSRTTPAAVDVIANKFNESHPEGGHILAVRLPHKRATIHLDMIFNIIDRRTALIYPPYLTGQEACEVIHIEFSRGGKRKITSSNNGLLSLLKSLGKEYEPVFCGGSDPVHQQREQWMSGNNFFAVAPGKIIGYNCNSRTFEALEAAGFRTVSAEKVIDGQVLLEDSPRIAVGISGTELARGGGGIRCMTMPFVREQ